MSQSEQDRGERRFLIDRYTGDAVQRVDDQVAVEEPLEIRIVYGPQDQRKSKSLSITMRTPGNDLELAAGFLLSENIIYHRSQFLSADHVGPPPANGRHGNTLMVELLDSVRFEPEQLQRHFYMTSSCGICGKASLEAIRSQGWPDLNVDLNVSPGLIRQLPQAIRDRQAVFETTGGLHAAALFDDQAQLLDLREDVGRHNAVDKLIGSRLLSCDLFPEHARILVVSGRASFELVQKALSASIEMLVAVGAPSSLAVELAREFKMTLVGFASASRFNVYSGFGRVTGG